MNKPLIVITGASSGIGEATAKRFSALGHPLLLVARRLDRLTALNLPNTLCKLVDITDRAALTSAIQEAENIYGPVDAIVNNAGVMLLKDVVTQDPQEWETMMQVNVMGLLNGVHAVLAGMYARQRGTIINISSVAGRKLFPKHAVYCGSKFAVHAISEGLREEAAAHNVRVVTIAPGAVETELLSHTTDEATKQAYEAWKTQIGGAIAADDIARSILYAYEQPANVCVREIVIAATRQEP